MCEEADASAPTACYICFDDSSDAGNELTESPCLCKKQVHRHCLSKWISTKGSRLCSICKFKLPIDCTVEAPFVVLQVVRHMRGLQWNGEREYVISFHDRANNYVTLGFGADNDLCLPDPSLSRTHSRIEYKEGHFYVEDLTSSAGTFLKLTMPHRLPVGATSRFKMGRTMLTLKVERRKPGMLQSWRASRKRRPEDGPSSPTAAGASTPTSPRAGVLSPSSEGAGGLLSPSARDVELDDDADGAETDPGYLSMPLASHAGGSAGGSGSGSGAGDLRLDDDVIPVEE